LQDVCEIIKVSPQMHVKQWGALLKVGSGVVMPTWIDWSLNVPHFIISYKSKMRSF